MPNTNHIPPARFGIAGRDGSVGVCFGLVGVCTVLVVVHVGYVRLFGYQHIGIDDTKCSGG